ncbi:MAG: 6,7-dimethyl-8-ribityllumazine synthase [Deltaproteobacteria bacterium]|nr:6,7-dimethyl-8-ribityllumazine synthase [Deltaproteobacteria bacterium]
MKKSSGVNAALLGQEAGKGLRVGIVVSRFNADITDRLREGAVRTLLDKGLLEKDIQVVSVPGAFEIPLTLQRLARTKKFHGLIALGVVIRGETPHFDYVAGECSRGVMQVSLSEGIPIGFGVLTTNDVEQAMERAGGRHASGRHGNKGEEAALVVIEMVKNGTQA